MIAVYNNQETYETKNLLQKSVRPEVSCVRFMISGEVLSFFTNTNHLFLLYTSSKERIAGIQ